MTDYEASPKVTAFFKKCAAGRDGHLKAFQPLAERLSEELGLNIRLDVFTEDTVRAYEEQWAPYLEAHPEANNDRYASTHRIQSSIHQTDPKTGDMSRLFNENYDPHHFTLAIWVNGVLCGIAYGGHQGEIERDYISVKVMEGHPNPDHPLKGSIAYIVDQASCAFGKEVGVSKVARIGPFSEGAESYHEKQGLASEPLVYNRDGMVTTGNYIKKL